MKLSNLLTGLEENPLSQDLILKNAFKEIDRLEEEVETLNKAIEGADRLVCRICKNADISYNKYLQKHCLYISASFEQGSPEYDFLKWSLELNEPEEKEEEDKNNDTV